MELSKHTRNQLYVEAMYTGCEPLGNQDATNGGCDLANAGDKNREMWGTGGSNRLKIRVS